MEFSRVERAAIAAILSKPVDGMEVPRAQFAAASVVKRDYTGVGFYTMISVPSSVPPMADSEELREALLAGAGGSPGVLFILWTHDGYLVCLEGYTIHKSWPNEDDIEGIGPCQLVHKAESLDMRRRLSGDGLISDCEDRFSVWRMSTNSSTLLAAALLAVIIVIGVLLVLILIGAIG
jgi:hypothetical protein